MGQAGRLPLTGGEAVVRALEAHGVELVFGIPGAHSLPIYRHLAGSSIRHVTTRHEQGAGFAADGYARASGRAGVCIVTTGPGVTNVATAAAQAYADSIPLLIVSPGMPDGIYRRDAGYVHETKDQSRAMHNLVAWSHRATSPSDVLRSIYRAFSEFESGRPRPVHVEIPLDVLDANEVVDVPSPPPSARPSASPARIDEALAILADSECPGLLVGGGAQGAAAEVIQLAHALDAIVVSTANGKGVFPEGDQLAVGAGLGFSAGRDALTECDVLVAVGTEVSDADLEGAKLGVSGQVIRIDIDAGQSNKNLTADCAIHADAADAIRLLLRGLPPHGPSGGAARAGEWRRRLAAEVESRDPRLVDFVAAIRDFSPEHTVIVCDTSQLCYNAVVPSPLINSPRSFLNPSGYATLGYALPAGIGAKLARRDRPVIVLIGDGGIMFTVSELAVAVEQELQMAIIVTSNHGYAEMRRWMEVMDIPPAGVTFDPPNFRLLAEAFGACGIVATNAAELAVGIQTAFSRPGPSLIELLC